MLGEHIRIEHWFKALSQPGVAAGSMLGVDAVYDQVVLREDKDKLELILFRLKDRRARARMNVNVWDQTDTIKALV